VRKFDLFCMRVESDSDGSESKRKCMRVESPWKVSIVKESMSQRGWSVENAQRNVRKTVGRGRTGRANYLQLATTANSVHQYLMLEAIAASREALPPLTCVPCEFCLTGLTVIVNTKSFFVHMAACLL
jgi:hypothetical protein